MNTQILEDLGLTKNEIKVYLALLEIGSTGAGPLIKKLHMYRAAVYELLDLLIDKGLVSYVIKANRKYFEAHDPDRLLEYVNSQRQELQDKEAQLKTLLPELRLRKKLASTQNGTVYQGKSGLKSIFEDILKEKSEWYVFGASGQFKELFPAYYIHFHKRRVQSNILLKIIFTEALRKTRESALEKIQLRYLPESYITPSTTYIYGDKIVILVWSPEPLAFMIRSKEVAESYREFFGVLWRTAKL